MNKPPKASAEATCRIAIDYRATDSLRPNPTNARQHTDRQIQQIADSIRAFGLNWPILVDRNGFVIAGHGRLQASKLLGLKQLPTIRLEHLNEHQIAAFAIADNRLAENSSWNERLLGEQLKILADADLNFDLEVIGFETAEIDMYIEGIEPEGCNSADPADTDLEPTSSVPVSQPEDLWNLAGHRILCGDARCADDFRRLMGERKADVVFSDPPYNVPIGGHAGGKGKIQHREFLLASGEMNSSEFTSFLAEVFTLVASHSSEVSLHYICMDWRHMREILAAGYSVYADLENLCVWVKDNAGMGSFYRSQHELVFVFTRGNSHRNNVELGKFGRSRTNVWRYPGVNSFARTTGEGNLLALHPTVKPVALVGDLVKDCTARGDLVLDPFLGSGTTVIAAARTGRICYGMDLDPLYVDTAIRRWQKHSGLVAVHESTNETFQQREEVIHASRR